MASDQRQHIDDCLSVRDGHLFVEDCDAVELARQFGTPLYVVSENQLRRNVRRFLRAFGERWPEGPVHVLPAIKANFVLALRHILNQEGAGCDTFGPAELHAALRTGVPPALISLNGSTKDRAMIERAVAAGARITIDSATEVPLVREAARALGMQAKVRLRLRPLYAEINQPTDFGEAAVPIKVAAQLYRLGIPTEDLLRIGPEVLAAEELKLTGVHVHLGRHSRDLAVWQGMVRSVVALLAEVSRAWGGWEPREIDLGGGYAAPRDPTARTTSRGQQRRPDEHAPSIEEYAEAITGTLRAELARYGLSAVGKTLEVEPGRSLYADAGIHLATVRNVKSQTEPMALRWIETDTSEVFLLDTVVESCGWTTYVASKADQTPTQIVEITGRSCNFDTIVHEATLPTVEAGDVIVFLDTGAYQEANASNFDALPRPATVLVCEDRAEVIKQAETLEDVFRRDVIPPRLNVDVASIHRYREESRY